MNAPAQAAESPRIRPRWYRRRRYSYPILLVVGYAAWLVALYVVQDGMIFPRELAGKPDPRMPRPHGVEEVWLEPSPGVRVPGWFMIGRGRGAASPGAAVLFAHGNAELMEDNIGFIREYERAGVSYLVMEFRGYGRAGGEPGQAAIVADALAFYDWLASNPAVRRERIVVHGRSIGGGVAAQVAARRPAAGLILESSFTSLARMARGYAAPEWLCRHPFRSDEAVRAYGGPVLILHGTNDRLIPVWHARRMHELARRSELVEFDAGHDDLPIDSEAYWEAVLGFMRRNGMVAAATGAANRTAATTPAGVQ